MACGCQPTLSQWSCGGLSNVQWIRSGSVLAASSSGAVLSCLSSATVIGALNGLVELWRGSLVLRVCCPSKETHVPVILPKASTHDKAPSRINSSSSYDTLRIPTSPHRRNPDRRQCWSRASSPVTRPLNSTFLPSDSPSTAPSLQARASTRGHANDPQVDRSCLGILGYIWPFPGTYIH